MIRKQIQLTEEQAKSLKKIAAQKKIPISEVIRQGIDFYLRSVRTEDQKEIRQRAIEVIGQFHSGLTDLSEKHDKYLAEIFEK